MEVGIGRTIEEGPDRYAISRSTRIIEVGSPLGSIDVSRRVLVPLSLASADSCLCAIFDSQVR